MKKTVLSIQHLLAMFGATVLVPILTGFNPLCRYRYINIPFLYRRKSTSIFRFKFCIYTIDIIS